MRFARIPVLFAIIAVLAWNGASAEQPRPRVDAQVIHASQPQLLAEALDKVKPTPSDRAQLYFLGVAG